MILAYWIFYVVVGLLLVCGFEHTFLILRSRIEPQATKHHLSILLWSITGFILLINHGPIAFIVCPTILPIALSHMNLTHQHNRQIGWKEILPHAWRMARCWLQTAWRR